MEEKIIVFPTKINTDSLSKKVLKNEPIIIKKYSNEKGDGNTQLGPDSLTSRFAKFNVLKWWGTRKLKQKIRLGYERYTGVVGDPLYVLCWANVMRKGEKIEPHAHSQDVSDPRDYLCGHVGVQFDTTTSTYYLDTSYRPQDTQVQPIVNKVGEMTIFPSHFTHWTDRYDGDSERITVAFDISSKRYFDYNMKRSDLGPFDWGDNFVKI